MQIKLGHDPDWRHADLRAMFKNPVRIKRVGTVKKLLAGLIVAIMPLALSGQGIRASSVIPTQSLIQHSAAFPRLRQRTPAVIAVTPAPAVTCNMPVAASTPNAPGADTGGIAAPPDRAVPIPTVRSACVNRMAGQPSDSELVKKP